MDRKFPYWILAALGLLLAVVNAFAIYHHLFFYIWWLDIPLHLLGGLWIGLLVLAYYAPRFREPDLLSDPAVLRTAVIAALVVGLFWEVFEFSLDRFIVINTHDMHDTLDDLLNDVIGAVFAAEIFVMEGFNKFKKTPAS